MTTRAYWYTSADVLVECQDCDYRADGKTAQGSAAQHHDRTGHVVRVEVSRVFVYGEDRPRKRRWWKAPTS